VAGTEIKPNKFEIRVSNIPEPTVWRPSKNRPPTTEIAVALLSFTASFLHHNLSPRTRYSTLDALWLAWLARSTRSSC
jgi:hypothetical protein